MGFQAGTDGYRGERMNKGTWLDRWGAQNNTDPAISSDFFGFFFVAPDTSPQLAHLSQNRL